jgi:hypothetical protein
VCLKNAVMSLLQKGEDKFLKKLVNILVLLLALWSRFHLFARKTDEKMSYKFFVVVIRKTISVHTKRHVTLDTFKHHLSRHAPR